MRRVLGRRSAGVAVLTAAVSAAAGFVPAATSSAVEPGGSTTAPTRAQPNPSPAPSLSAGWRAPDPSTEQPPADVLGHTTGSVRVSVVRASDHGPLTRTEVLPGRHAALAAVAAAQDDPQVLAVEQTAPVRLLASDPLRSSQWALDTLHAETVWQSSTGSGVRVAVVDTGVYADHQDLGTSEAGGPVLVGADCTTSSPSCSGTGRRDGHGHGTHVAGIVAAQRENGRGISGLAPDARILPVKVLSAGGYGYDSWVANGIRYAANHGADVVNLSLGSTSNSTAISTAVDYARGQGVIVAAAAGNDGMYGSPPSYPGALDTVIGVAATRSSDQVASFSTRGSYVDVAAPGESVLSTLPSGYASWSGTSMATPYVAATVALMQEKKAGLTADEAVAALERTASDLGSAGRDDASGYGRINPAAAVACVQDGCTQTPPPVVRETTWLRFVPRRTPVAPRVGTSTVKARLTTGVSSTPVAGVSTTLRIGPPARKAGEAVTNADGVARFTLVNPGRSWVRACFAGDDELLPDCTVRRWLSAPTG